MLTRFLLLLLMTVAASAADTRAARVSLLLCRVGTAYEVDLRNAGKTPIFYTGLGASPLFELDVLKHGRWKPESYGVCGNGISEARMHAGAQLSGLTVPTRAVEIERGTKFRVAWSFAVEPYAEGKKRETFTVYSNEITYVPIEGRDF